jgi:hypothetical protein
MHGGHCTGPRNPNTVHGMYKNAFTADEQQLYDKAAIDSVDEEIRLLTIRIKRFNEYLVRIEANPNDANALEGFELDKVKRTGGRVRADGRSGGTVTEVESKRPDYRAYLSQYIQRRANLVDLRHRMAQQGGGASTEDAAKQWREAMAALEGSVPKPEGGDSDD